MKYQATYRKKQEIIIGGKIFTVEQAEAYAKALMEAIEIAKKDS